MNDFDKFERDLLKMASEFKGGKYAKKFLKQQGRKLNKKQNEQITATSNEVTGNLRDFENLKTGKVYKYQSDSLCVRAYSKSPHAHLVDRGHIVVDKNGVEHGYKQGVYFMEKAENSFQEQNFNDTQKFIDKMLHHHGMS